MAVKHRIKMALRGAYARLLFHTGLHALVDRFMPPRLTILAGHCVGSDANGQGHLPADMTISSAKLERLVDWFGRRYEVCSIGAGVQALENGSADRSGGRKRSLLALSFDDGYRDNYSVLLPLLRKKGVSATVFLESRPLDNRLVNWSHKYFWILERLPALDFVRRYGELAADRGVAEAAEEAVRAEPGRAGYRFKRLLKYEADPADRDAVIDQVFGELGGDERALCDELYMTWDEARELDAAGVELGGHTVNHPILSRLDAAAAEREVSDGAASLRSELGRERVVTFAYPWGRRWDFNEETQRAVRLAGFETAVTMHPGVNGPESDPWTYARLAIDDACELHLLAAEACGGFELLRRFGLDLSE